jgi:hypothetical protein
MFATDCAICHKNAVGLSRAPGYFGLESFLREHYTASREAAAKIAAYLRSVDAAQPPRAAGKRRGTEARTKPAKPESKPGAKPAEEKSGGSKTDVKTDAKAEADKPAETKPAESKPPENKPPETTPAEAPANASTPAANSDKSD